jgi:hypothetical protein
MENAEKTYQESRRGFIFAHRQHQVELKLMVSGN